MSTTVESEESSDNARPGLTSVDLGGWVERIGAIATGSPDAELIDRIAQLEG